MATRLLLLLAAVALRLGAGDAAPLSGNPPLPEDPPPNGAHSRGLAQSGDVSGEVAGLPLRLADGSSRLDGRIEVQLGGLWGTVCADGMTASEARVVCARLGLTGGAMLAVPRGPLPFMLGNVKCKGSEALLAQCQFGVTSACRSGRAAGVACTNAIIIDARLEDDTSYYSGRPWGADENSGRLEVRLSNTRWGTVCDAGASFGDREAQVVCRTLGKVGGRAVRGAAYGPGKLPIAVRDVRCAGTEANLTLCRYTTDTAGCTHDQDISVECRGAPNMPLRLTNRGVAEFNRGRLEVQIGGRWGLVCGKGFSNAAAAVACKKLGMRGGKAVPSAGYGATSLPILLSGMGCTGTERDLSACTFSTKRGMCTRAQAAAVRCEPYPFSDFEFVSGDPIKGTRQGYLKAAIELPTVATKGVICRDGWTEREARVACRSIGFTGGRLLQRKPPASLQSIPLVATNVKCKGREDDLSACLYDLYAPGTGCKSGAAGVACTGPYTSDNNTYR